MAITSIGKVKRIVKVPATIHLTKSGESKVGTQGHQKRDNSHDRVAMSSSCALGRSSAALIVMGPPLGDELSVTLIPPYGHGEQQESKRIQDSGPLVSSLSRARAVVTNDG
jgi:hypothetical protein